ncbi:MAG: Rpn family recombination-promoting nuclease/putative transposase [Okeania sp. SIO3C4]|nr:Rpn family recombination-promoting nuclease/putative transposase [Okeania sp. SIO3C4]
MAYDNTCKYLAETYAPNFVRWLLGVNHTNVQVIKTEIIPEPIRSDALILLQVDNKILHLEFQTFPYSEPPIPYRMVSIQPSAISYQLLLLV